MGVGGGTLRALSSILTFLQSLKCSTIQERIKCNICNAVERKYISQISTIVVYD